MRKYLRKHENIRAVWALWFIVMFILMLLVAVATYFPRVSQAADPAHEGIFTCVGSAKYIVDKDGKLYTDKSTGPKYAGIYDGNGGYKRDPNSLPICDFPQLITQLNFLMNWSFKILVPIVTVIFIWFGFQFLSSSSSKRTDAKKGSTRFLINSDERSIFFFSGCSIVFVCSGYNHKSTPCNHFKSN